MKETEERILKKVLKKIIFHDGEDYIGVDLTNKSSKSYEIKYD